jgi:hypothetical protein
MTNKERYANNFVLNFLESTTWILYRDIVLINIIFKDVVSNVVVTYNLLD